MQEDPAHAPDRPIARGHRNLDDFGPAALEHAAHARERLVLGELRSLGKQAPAHAGLRLHSDHARHRRIRIAGFEVDDRTGGIPDRPQHTHGIRHEVERFTECRRAVAEQPRQPRVRQAHCPHWQATPPA